MEDLNWEVYVIKDDSQKNAFVIPGGKVFVFRYPPPSPSPYLNIN